MIAAKHILGTFDEALASLRNNVLMMARLTERSLDRAMKGLFDRNDNLCANAIADDEEIDQLEKQIDKDGVDILLRFQPVASDLRRVVVGDETFVQPRAHWRPGREHCPQGAKTKSAPAAPGNGIDHSDVGARLSMFKDSVDAYVREDVQQGRDLIPRDEKLDELNRTSSRRLIERMAQDPDQLRGYLNLIFIGRHLERVGDHATNIAEDAVYAAAAEDIRHQPFVPAAGDE